MKTQDLIDRLQYEWNRERPELDTSGMGIVGRVILLGELLKKSAQAALEPFDIGYTDLDVLATLRRSGEPYELRPTELLEAVLLQSGSLTACIDRLEAAGLVARQPIPEDRRGLSIRLTPAGRRLVDEAIEVRFEEARAIVASFSREERLTVEGLLRRLLLPALGGTEYLGGPRISPEATRAPK